MLKIKQKRGRAWARLLLRIGFTSAVFYMMFGVLFGITMGTGGEDGNVVMFCRVCRDYAAGDLLVMRDGELVEYGDGHGGLVAGKAIASLRIRGFSNENDEQIFGCGTNVGAGAVFMDRRMCLV